MQHRAEPSEINGFLSGDAMKDLELGYIRWTLSSDMPRFHAQASQLPCLQHYAARSCTRIDTSPSLHVRMLAIILLGAGGLSKEGVNNMLPLASHFRKRAPHGSFLSVRTLKTTLRNPQACTISAPETPSNNIRHMTGIATDIGLITGRQDRETPENSENRLCCSTRVLGGSWRLSKWLIITGMTRVIIYVVYSGCKYTY